MQVEKSTFVLHFHNGLAYFEPSESSGLFIQEKRSLVYYKIGMEPRAISEFLGQMVPVSHSFSLLKGCKKFV